MSLRIRLTLWYLASLTLILLAFSSFLYWQTRRSLLLQVDASLQLAATQSLLNIDTTNTPRFEDVPTLLNTLDKIDNNLALQLVASDGTIYQTIGSDLEEDEAEEEDDQFPAVLPSSALQTASIGDNVWRIYGENVADDTWLQVGQSLDLLEDNLAALLSQIIWGMPLALLVAGGGGYLLATGALRPVTKITQTAQSISGDDLSQRIGYVGVKDEIGQLANTFDTMLDRLEDAFVRERRFTNDAAHELRTPLTALKGQIDVTLSQPRSTESYVETLTTLNEQVDRLITLSKSLLFMARLDQGEWQIKRELIDLQDFLPAIIELVQPLAEEKDITVTQQIDPVTVRGNHDLLIQAVLNLLDNAVSYSDKGDSIAVSAFADGDKVCLRVSDTGIGIESEHLPYLFDRFYRVDASRTHAGGREGTGLGLAIVQKIVEAHSGTIAVDSTVGIGTIFTISLPAQ